MLELLEVLYWKGMYIMQDRVEVWIDNRYVNKKVCGELLKPSLYALDSRAEIARMKEIIKEYKFKINIKIINGHSKI